MAPQAGADPLPVRNMPSASVRVARIVLPAAVGLTARGADAQLVMGRVVDSATRRPLPSLPVRLMRTAPDGAAPDTAPVARAYTARDGAFTLTAPGAGTYRVRIASGLLGPPLVLASVDSVDQHEYLLAMDPTLFLFEFQVDKQAATVPGSVSLRYPALLQSQNVEGKVIAQFVVDTAGRAEMGTWRVLETSNALFSAAARDAVRGATFYPAEFRGRKVRQLVQLPLAFTLNRTVPLPTSIPEWPPRHRDLPRWPD